MIYDGRNRNNFVLCDFVTPDYVRYIVVRCEEDKHDAVRNCLEYWIRNTLCEYEYTYPTENEYIPKNMINEPDKALNELLGRTRLTLDILFEKRSIT
ncbi:hypothetical protein SAMN05444392_106148 [Seinonella peptonophila]|uniref:Uncharacterized protein n=2 Tax=Seinonella peptonophila TaxID=112248 RepID=A0A1M4YB90_9BACL|nr:hypothetical protein SAMN05444392_106148 [Seinonella peptonophila]